MREVDVLKSVLVVGDNPHAWMTKNNLEEWGFLTYIARGEDILKLSGMVGNFEIEVRKNGSYSSLKTGAVVVAESIEKEFCKDIKGKNPHKIITQGELEKVINPYGKTRKEILSIAGKTPHVICFLLGDGSQFSKTESMRCLQMSLVLKKRLGSKVFVLCKDLKISPEGGEELYRCARKEGVIFLKNVEAPQITAEEKIKIKLDDYYLTEEGKMYGLNIDCDLLVIDELSVADDNLKRLGEILGVGGDVRNFLQPENINLYPIFTNRKGIFLVGQCHNPDLMEKEIEREISVLCGEIGNLFYGEEKTFEDIVKINPEKCAVCLTCFRSCPHKAIGVGEEGINRGHAFIFNPACFSCGVCVSFCPAGAIEFEKFNDQDIFNLLEEK